MRTPQQSTSPSCALPPNPKGVRPNQDAAASGDRRQALEVLRDTLALQLDTTTSAIHAQLAAQYRATLAELDALKHPEAKSARDRLAERVAAAHVVA